VSAVLADASEEKETPLAEYGFNLGMAFQIADDLFDYILDAPQLGKEIGADLREGKVTLPLIHALRHCGAADREWLTGIIRNRQFSTADFSRLVSLLKTGGAVAYTKQAAERYIDAAKKALSVFEPSDTLETMTDIADYALHRRV
jgi:octaprenyl-diphosphate synthase